MLTHFTAPRFSTGSMTANGRDDEYGGNTTDGTDETLTGFAPVSVSTGEIDGARRSDFSVEGRPTPADARHLAVAPGGPKPVRERRCHYAEGERC